MSGEGTIDIGLARYDELDRLASLVADTYVQGGFIDHDSPYLSQLRDTAARWREADLIVARRGGVAVGTVTFCGPGTPWSEISQPGEAEFRMLAVEPASQGRGIGRRLVAECLDRTARAGATATVISTVPTMTAAQRMYERMGFVRTPDRDWAPRPGVDLITYRRYITSSPRSRKMSPTDRTAALDGDSTPASG